jgi:hypothetical protein
LREQECRPLNKKRHTRINFNGKTWQQKPQEQTQKLFFAIIGEEVKTEYKQETICFVTKTCFSIKDFVSGHDDKNIEHIDNNKTR